MTRTKMMSVCGIALVAALILTIREHPRRMPYRVVTESGHMLPSLFFEVPRAQWVKDIAISVPSGTSSCAEKSPGHGVVKRFLSVFQLRTVSAQNCQPDECAGAYFTDSYEPCGEDCGGGEYDYPISGGGLPFEGWQYTGGTDCADGCVCQGQTCSVE